jgi:hypothetical protein
MERKDFKRMWMNVFKITGKMDKNLGTIVIETQCSREFFNEFFKALYGDDHPEGAEVPIGEWKVVLSKEKF